MSIVIKNVDKEIYARFKAKAALNGLKIGEAITEAMKEWIKDKLSPDSPLAIQEKNKAAYRRLIPDLRRDFLNKWAVITDGKLLGIYKTENELLEAISTQEEVPNLLFQITERKPQKIVRLGVRRITYGKS